VQEAKCRPRRGVEIGGVTARGVEQLEGATTLVVTKARGPSIERSTWVSAAKFTMAVGRWAASAAATAERSVMSAWTKVKRGSEATSFRLSRLPA